MRKECIKLFVEINGKLVNCKYKFIKYYFVIFFKFDDKVYGIFIIYLV